jgi:DNA-binding transcriptional ArsR family regulator
MVDDGCTLGQTLHVMEERCKSCNVVSPMFCVDQCETWKVKKELREIDRILSEEDHRLKLVNALKNNRRLTILQILWERPFSVDSLQKELAKCGLHHSKKTIRGYLKPLLKAGLVRESGKRFLLTLYGRKVYDAVMSHGFEGQLPIHSGGYEERILRSLLDGGKTRSELVEVGPAKSLSRVLKRLLERKLIVNNSPSARVFYFRTKRALSLEQLSPTQRRICDAIPPSGISAGDLAEAVGISLRRVYKYLRSLRGKKLVFRRDVPVRYELTEHGRAVAKFLEEIAGIE